MTLWNAVSSNAVWAHSVADVRAFWVEMAPTFRPRFQSRKQHCSILALTSQLAHSGLHVPFWLSLIAHDRLCQWRFQWFVPVWTHSVSQLHLQAILARFLSGFAHVPLTILISGSIVGSICESIFSGSCRNMLEKFCLIFSGPGNAHWMA